MIPEPDLRVPDWVASIQRESQALVRAVAASGLDTAVPTCPGWQVSDLVQHLGGVHRWATAHLRDARQEMMPHQEAAILMRSFPRDADLLTWFEEGQRELVEAVSLAPPDLSCWTFLPAPSPLEFWARRQAHETEIHRADVEFAGAAAGVSFESSAAADGIEEMLFGFAARLGHLDLTDEMRMELAPADLNRRWSVRLTPHGVAAERGTGGADCRLCGSVSDLYLLLWNRLPAGSASLEGSPAALEQWQGSVRIRWG